MKGGFCASEVSPACRSCWWMTRNSTNFLCCKLSKTHKPHSWWTRQAHTHIKTHTSPQIVCPLCPRSSSVRSDPCTCAHTRHLSQWGAVVTWPEEQQLWSICLSVSVSCFWISLFWLFCLAWVSWRVDMVFYFEGSQDQRSLGVVGVGEEPGDWQWESWCHWMWIPAHSQDDDWWDFSHLWHFSSVIIQFASCRECYWPRFTSMNQILLFILSNKNKSCVRLVRFPSQRSTKLNTFSRKSEIKCKWMHLYISCRR